ncbi:MAG: glycoside hydrolase family 3 protein [Leptospiraceae bacterium]|nr:glycoside hydrolase family 3 protein [Leptospiraceae bacterium]MDW7976821.1 glycoside hydrolase family 3 protein [Leptospiraceae bacterium]
MLRIVFVFALVFIFFRTLLTSTVGFQLKWDLFLWDHFYEHEWNEVLDQISNKITQKVPIEIQIGQILHSGISGTKVNPELAKQIQHYCLGGFILFKSNIESKEQLKILIDDLQKLSLEHCKIPLFFGIDQEGGRVERITGFVKDFPSAMAVGQTGKSEYAWLMGFLTGYEMFSLGIPLVYAPVADINNNPLNPVINTRSFGSDEETVSKMVVSYIEGINYTHAIGFLKHFPGHGDTTIDSHFDLPIIDKSEEELWKLELKPFLKGIRAKAKGVMIAHILYPKLDDVPSSLSKKIIQELLKNKMNFQGIVITDALEMKAVSRTYLVEDLSYRSFIAGVDILLLTAQNQNVDKIYKFFLEKLKNKELPKERIQESFRMQMAMKLSSFLFPIELLMNEYQIPNDLLEKYKQLFEFKNQISQKIYERIQKRFPNIEYQISYEGIRSLYKNFPKLDLDSSRVFVFYQKQTNYEEWKMIQNQTPEVIFWLAPFNEFEMWKYIFEEDDYVIVEIKNSNEWNEISQQDLIYRKLIGYFDGVPFQPFFIKENQYIIASFSPTITSNKAMIRKIMNDSIPKARLKLAQE